MKTDTIREVARQMREAHGPEHKRHKMWDEMASLLEGITEDFTDEEDYEDNDFVSKTYDVAVAYLTADTGESVTHHDTSQKIPGIPFQPCEVDQSTGMCTVPHHWWTTATVQRS